jgi:phytoene/squalene synthetase
MPVGRFVLDVHGEDRATWAASDALCAALQVINHVQDCGKDYRKLDRVYLPADALAAAATPVEAIGAARASPGLLRCLREMTAQTERLLRDSEVLPLQVANTRLALEITVIQTYARRILGLLKSRDPLSERVHLGKWTMAGFGVAALATGLCRRVTRKPVPAGAVPHT